MMARAAVETHWSRRTLVDELARRSRVGYRDTSRVLDELEAIIVETLAAGGRVSLMGFGTFATRERASRKGVHPRRPWESIEIPARRVATFAPGARLQEEVRRPSPTV